MELIFCVFYTHVPQCPCSLRPSRCRVVPSAALPLSGGDPIRIAYYESPSRTAAISLETDWDGIRQLLSRYTPHQCDGPSCSVKRWGEAWSPVDIEDGATRLNVNVRAATLAVFDLDHLTIEAACAVGERLLESGLTHIIHSTHSNQAKGEDDVCLRVVFPLTRPVLPGEWRRFRAITGALLTLSTADPATEDLSHLYYLPSGPNAGDFIFESVAGESLDVDLILAQTVPAESSTERQPAGSPAPTQPIVDSGVDKEDSLPERASHLQPVDPAAEPRPVDMADARGRLRKLRKAASLAVARRILNGDSLGPVGGQDNTLRDMVSVLVFALPDLPDDALLELLRPSLSATQWLDGQEHLRHEAQKKITRSRARLKERDDRARAIAERLGVREGETPRTPKAQDPDPDAGDPAGAADSATNTPAESPTDWRQDLKTIEDASGAIRLRQLVSNAHTILKHSDEWRGVFRFNSLAKRIEMHGGPLPADTAPSFYGVEVAQWLALTYDLHIAARTIAELIAAEARCYAYDPLRDYLLALRWDGTPRLESMLETYFKADTQNEACEDISTYVRAAGAKWMLGAASRGLNPGAPVQETLVLEGAQGCGKSYAAKILGGGFFCTLPGMVGDKDSMMVLSSHWVIEIEELAALRAADTAANKRFLSRPVDTFRPPYGAIMEEFPRRCAFLGTTNRDDYLSDPTGNRRHWPVRVGEIDHAALLRDRDQLWAEAVARVQAGESWQLPVEARAAAKAETQARMPDDPRAARFERWWVSMIPRGRPSAVTTHDVARALEEPHVTRALEMEIGFMLRDLGFSRERRMIGGVRVYMYAPPDEWITRSQQRNNGFGSVLPSPHTPQGGSP